MLFNALVRMFEEALKAVRRLDPDLPPPLISRLEQVRVENRKYGYGTGDDMNHLMVQYGFERE